MLDRIMLKCIVYIRISLMLVHSYNSSPKVYGLLTGLDFVGSTFKACFAAKGSVIVPVYTSLTRNMLLWQPVLWFFGRIKS